MEIFKNIEGYQIYIGGTWCEVTKEGKHVFDGSVEEGTTAEEVYNMLNKDNIITFKNAAGFTIKVKDNNNYLNNEIIEGLKMYDDAIYWSDDTCKHWMFDFKIENVWFESTNIDLVNYIIELTAFDRL